MTDNKLQKSLKNQHILSQPLSIGGLKIENRIWVAPMAGVTDNPFRRLCKSFGAGHAVSEMIIADTALYARKKSISIAHKKLWISKPKQGQMLL